MTLAPSRAGDRLASQDLGAHLLGGHPLANTTAEIFPDTPTRDADTPASRRNLRSCVAASAITITATTARTAPTRTAATTHTGGPRA